MVSSGQWVWGPIDRFRHRGVVPRNAVLLELLWAEGPIDYSPRKASTTGEQPDLHAKRARAVRGRRRRCCRRADRGQLPERP